MSVVTSFVRELPEFWISVRITPAAKGALKRGRIRVTENTSERVGLTGLQESPMCPGDRRSQGQRFPRRALVVGAMILAVCLVASCATSQKNQRLESYSSDQGYRYKNISPGEHNSDSLFLILTFSGGGTRAASFSYGALEKLRDTEILWEGERRRLLDEVDVISSVSGGSLTAAYYSLFGERTFEDFPDRVLYKNIQSRLVDRILSLRKQVKLFSPYYGRTDVMAEMFHKHIFDKKTYADLLHRDRRPFVIVNATDMFRGRRFVFDQDQFDLLYSDLSTYPVGHAVAASAAFPGALTPLTVKNYEKGSDFVLPAEVSKQLALEDRGSGAFEMAELAQSYVEPDRPYVHLIDGGVSDNLGLVPVIRILTLMRLDSPIRSAIRADAIEKFVVISVNAKPGTKTKWDRKKKVPGPALTLSAASTTPMNSLSQLQINYVRLLMEKMTEEQKSAPRQIDYHYVEVAFDWIQDEEERAYLKSIPTTFSLPDKDVDRLRQAAATTLDHHPAFQELLRELTGCRDQQRP
jgi:NTE family protein